MHAQTDAAREIDKLAHPFVLWCKTTTSSVEYCKRASLFYSLIFTCFYEDDSIPRFYMTLAYFSNV